MKNGGKNLKKNKISTDFLAEKIIENALNLHATDVHIEPREEDYLVRFRINGALKNIENIQKNQANKLVRFFKSLANLNLSEKTFAQQETIDYGKIKIRVSSTPVFLGEKITLRLMKHRTDIRKLNEIGLWGDNLNLVKQAINSPQGVIFTIGGGKNTTNFAILNEINSSEKNIVTVERRIEKQIAGINQIETNPKIGLDYFNCLKAALSQNPDVILIDNIIDKNTAELAFEAAMSGKLIIANLPVRKTSEVIPFLHFLGIPDFLVSANILAIICQSLVRTVSKNTIEYTKISKVDSKSILSQFNIKNADLHNLEISAKKHFSTEESLKTSKDSILYLPVLKDNTNENSFIGTTAIFEVASFIDGKFGRDFKNFIMLKPNSAEVEEFLEENNFKNIKIDGLIKSLRGHTSLNEVIRSTGY